MILKKALSGIFGAAVNSRNRKYDRKRPDELVRCQFPIISIGNLSVGGTGKTPFATMLAMMLKSRGHKPVIIGRGYKKKSRGLIVVSDGEKILSDVESAGDEMMLFALTLGIPVVAHESKSEAAALIEGRFDFDCAIVDDGFQHRALARDLDIVLVDKSTIERPYLIPEGRLREPLSSLGRADIICMTGNAELPGEILKGLGGKVIIRVASYSKPPYILGSTASQSRPFKKGHEIIPFSGIARPERFYGMLLDQGFDIIDKITFGDHHNYSESDIRHIIERCRKHGVPDIATTEKDAVKLIRFENMIRESSINCHVFPISLKIIEGENAFIRAVESLFKS